MFCRSWTTLQTDKYASPRIKTHRSAPSFRRRKETHLPAFSTLTLNRCQHVPREGLTDRVERVFAPKYPYSGSSNDKSFNDHPRQFHAAVASLWELKKQGVEVLSGVSRVALPNALSLTKRPELSAAKPEDTNFDVEIFEHQATCVCFTVPGACCRNLSTASAMHESSIVHNHKLQDLC